MCTITLDSLVATSATTITVSGKIIGNCQEVSVTVDLDGDGSHSGNASLSPGTAPDQQIWTFVITGLAEDTIKGLCKDSHSKVTVTCTKNDNCEEEFPGVPLECCPGLAFKNLSTGDCIQRTTGNYRRLLIQLSVDWPQNYTEDVTLSIGVWPQGEPETAVEKSIIASPDQTDYTQDDFDPGASGSTDIFVRAGFPHEGNIVITQPERCDSEAAIPKFDVPDCDCINRPPASNQFFTVTDSSGSLVSDPNDSCVNGDTATITAGNFGGVLEWTVFTSDDDYPFTVLANPARTIRLNLPADGTRVTVMATVGTGDCREPVVTSVKRCGVDPEPPDQPTPPDDGDPTPPDDGDNGAGNGGGGGFSLCDLLSFLMLLGAAFLAFGLVLLWCPGFSGGVLPAAVPQILGGVLVGLGIGLFLGALLAWIFLCHPSPCDWGRLLWQCLFIFGILFAYAGLCPTCLWFLLGFILVAVAIGLAFAWKESCNISTCGFLKAWLFVTIAFDIAGALEGALGWCAITSNPGWATIYGLIVLGFNAWLMNELNRNNCLSD